LGAVGRGLARFGARRRASRAKSAAPECGKLPEIASKARVASQKLCFFGKCNFWQFRAKRAALTHKATQFCARSGEKNVPAEAGVKARGNGTASGSGADAPVFCRD
jgi:hypothetical protein